VDYFYIQVGSWKRLPQCDAACEVGKRGFRALKVHAKSRFHSPIGLPEREISGMWLDRNPLSATLTLKLGSPVRWKKGFSCPIHVGSVAVITV